ncbi:MAG: transcription elongation factor GreA, partial [Collinsella sp.]|nr:transcription elongation factor GreA [Collinsella sp.]
MDASQIVLTAEGRQKLVEELAWREGDYAKEIVEDIKEARAFGDLSENSEYDAAKDKQAQNAARIAEIQAILANAQVAATTGDLTVSIGSTVSLIDPNGEVMEVTLVGTTETNSLEHKISNESPVGHAIIGHGEGDSVEV